MMAVTELKLWLLIGCLPHVYGIALGTQMDLILSLLYTLGQKGIEFVPGLSHHTPMTDT